MLRALGLQEHPHRQACDAFADGARHCDATVDRADCLQVARIFGDEALANATACNEKSCSAMGACIDAELSLD